MAMAAHAELEREAANDEIDRFESIVEAQLDRQGSECFNDIKETVTSLVVKHQTPADRRHVSLLSTVRKIIQDAEVLIRYDDKLKVMEAQAVDHQLRDFASVDRGLVEEAAISMTNALKSAGASASKAIQKLGDATLFNKEQQVMRRKARALEAVQPLRALAVSGIVDVSTSNSDGAGVPEKLQAASRLVRQEQQAQLQKQTGDVLYPAEGTRTENVPTTRKGEFSAGQLDANVPL